MNIKEKIEEYETKIELLKLFSLYLVNDIKEDIVVERRDGSLDNISIFVEDEYGGWRSNNLYYEADGRSVTSSDWDIVKVL